jgi:hypothetical protein
MISKDDIDAFTTSTERTIKVEEVKEHEDGSATYSLDLDDETASDLAAIGVKVMLYCTAANMSLNELFDILTQYVEEVKSDV